MATDTTYYILLPEHDARLINGHVFARDVYKDPKTGKEGDPRYKVQLAFDDTDEIRDALDEILADEALKHWGGKAYDEYYDGTIQGPLRDGNDLKAKREANGKSGDAFENKIVLSADTKFNANGDDADGGIRVYDEQAEIVPMMQKDKIYNGCYVKAEVSVYCYEGEDRNGKFKAMKFYLSAVQFIKDGERLRSAARNPFEAQVRDAGDGGRERSRRRRKT